MSSNRGINKHNKRYYKSSSNFQFKRRKYSLEPGCKGFLITCNAQEQRCIREAYNVLNEFADKLYGETKQVDPNTVNTPDSSTKKSIEDELEGELQSMRSDDTKKYRFSQRSTGVKNVLFIKSEVGDPCKIALTVLRHVKETQNPVSRFLLRLIPVLSVCKAMISAVKETTSEILDEFLINHEGYNDEARNVTYSVQYHARNNSKALAKEEVYTVVNELLVRKEIPWKVNLDNPDLIVNVDLLGTMCCIGVLIDYAGFKKYNLIELAKSVSDPPKEIDEQEKNDCSNETTDVIKSPTPDKEDEECSTQATVE